MEHKAHIKNAVAVREYVVNAIDCSGDTTQKLNYFFKNFKAEYDYEANRKRYGSLTNMVREYLLGLPSTISVEFTYFEIEKLLKEWGYIHDRTTEKQYEIELDNYWKYLAVGLCVMGRRAGIKGIEGL